jgi:hypothetical protein
MADWSKPGLTDTYANFLAYLTARDVDSATMFSLAAPTNPVNGMVRWNPTNLQFEQYSTTSSTWTQLWTSGLNVPSITLSANPTTALQAATKQYVDAVSATIAAVNTTATAALPKVGGTLTGRLTLSYASPGIVINAAAAGQQGRLDFYTNTSVRWGWVKNSDAESGSNAGSTFMLNRYNDSGTLLDSPISVSRVTGLTTFTVRPLFGSATPWDTTNLPSPFAATGGNVTGDLNLYQNSVAGGDASRLTMTNAVSGLSWRMRLNGTSSALEFINSAYNQVNMQFFDNGNLNIRGSIQGVQDIHINGSAYFAPNWQADSNGAGRIMHSLGDLTTIKGAGGSGNWTLAVARNDGTNMAVAAGSGDFYVATLGWITAIINAKAPAGTFHHNATATNCGSVASLAVAASGNTLQLTLTSNNCNCNCACSCFPAGALVLMADGTEKPIEQVVEGDMVMGALGKPVRIEGVDRPVLGSRSLMQFEDGSLQWSDEHLLWGRRDGHEWWWGANPVRWRFEASIGHVGGLFESAGIMEGWFGTEFAHVDGWKQNDVQPVANPDPYTQLYLPYTNGSPIIVNGYVVGARVNEWDYDYRAIHWEDARLNVQEQCHACLSN